ncbi:GlxA family transcriptional regulator [Endozoicomonas sp. 8E]|uniref:GlxA family transcriptional regulator n=1 Tax=Endozoicomonas sp. 8E TaxID=3035692 RepID=UPI0029392385|nr:helix-turn-helix domain-containing protein [Endozoicomonas sp. 8E]WOG26747.1 helix-turn-helix domain-containing protein [Endozoicomonas sp. 8E]
MSKPCKVGFLLYPGFSLLGFSSALEVLRAVNQVTGQRVYESVVIAESAVTSNLGLSIEPSQSALEFMDVVILVASKTEVQIPSAALSEASVLGGIGKGANLLASAGLLDGYRARLEGATDALQELYPRVALSQTTFELDRNRMTCGAGTAAMDMMLSLVAREQGVNPAASVSELLVRDRLGGPVTSSFVVPPVRKQQPQIEEATQLMAANIEEPLGADELASLVGISRRQLERLFRKYLDTVPSRHYLKLRLEHARKLLRETDNPVVDVGVACGFSNASHFSTAYKNHFDLTPREERQS